MNVKSMLKPGQNGTKELVKKYGDQLVCVRYRYDKVKQKRYKTVELIVSEQDWVSSSAIDPDKTVYVRVDYGETGLRAQVKKVGANWNPQRKVWVMSYRKVLELGLEERVVGDEEGL